MFKVKETRKEVELPGKEELLKLGYTSLTSEILLNRYEGKTLKEIKSHLMGKIGLDKINIKEVDDASKYLREKIEEGKKILIVTDYDCDGISSASMTYRLLRKSQLPKDQFFVITNKRMYGNGVNLETIERVENFKEYDIMITADHGSSNNDVYKVLKTMNPKLEIIVTDHHTYREDNYPSEAKFFINNQRVNENKEWEPLKDLSGCFIMFFLLYKTLKGKLKTEDFLIEALPFLAITAISDVMSMDNEINRRIINIGLNIMNRPFSMFKYIANYCIPEKHYSVETIKYTLSPLINTGNRQHCEEIVFQLLTSETPSEMFSCLEILLAKNNERKRFTNELTSAILNSSKLRGEYGRTITIKTKMGINGIIASKIGEIKQSPCICFIQDGEHFHGSGRSIIPEVDIVKILGRLNQDGLVERFGGHREAAGCLVSEKHIEEFRNKFDIYVKEELDKHKKSDEVMVFKKLLPKNVNINNIVNLKHLEPLGKDFETPEFYCELTITNCFSSSSMTFMNFEEIQPNIKGVAFHNGRYDHKEIFKRGNKIGIVFTMKLSYFKGTYQASLNITNAKLIGEGI